MESWDVISEELYKIFDEMEVDRFYRRIMLDDVFNFISGNMPAERIDGSEYITMKKLRQYVEITVNRLRSEDE